MRRSSNVTHLVYDMDGLLLDTEPFYTKATQIIAGKYGKVFDWSVKSQMIGKRASDSARLLVESLELPLTPAEYLSGPGRDSYTTVSNRSTASRSSSTDPALPPAPCPSGRRH